MLAASVAVLLLFGAVGMLLAARFADPTPGSGFWRLCVLLVLAGMGLGLGLRLAGLTERLPDPGGVALLAYAACAVALVGFGLRAAVTTIRAGDPLLTGAAAAGLLAILTDPVTVPAAGPALERIVYAAGMLGLAVALGSVTLAMVLAHWYLIEPRMPIGPLQRAVGLIVGTEILKLLLVAAVLAIHGPEWAAGEGGVLRALVLGDALFVAVRAFLGVLAPLGLAWMTWKTVQIRSIQSATGILYAAIVFVLFGEVISLFLQLSSGRPF